VSLLELCVGFLLGIFISSIWDIYFKGILEARDLNRTVLEHYHAGLALFLISHYVYPSFLMGLGTALIFDERVQDHPFAIGKKDSIYSHGIGIFLLILNIVIRLGGIK
jgi:hypothetical protein